MFSNGKLPVIKSLRQTGPELHVESRKLAGRVAPPLGLHGDTLPRKNMFCESQDLLLLSNM
jgi:hypothetical protein